MRLATAVTLLMFAILAANVGTTQAARSEILAPIAAPLPY